MKTASLRSRVPESIVARSLECFSKSLVDRECTSGMRLCRRATVNFNRERTWRALTSTAFICIIPSVECKSVETISWKARARFWKCICRVNSSLYSMSMQQNSLELLLRAVEWSYRQSLRRERLGPREIGGAASNGRLRIP